jgi:hypothetical protein
MVNNTSESKKRTKRTWFFDHPPDEVSYFLNDRPVCLKGRPLVFVTELADRQFPLALLWCMMWPCLGIVQKNVNSTRSINRRLELAGMMPAAKSTVVWSSRKLWPGRRIAFGNSRG